MKRSEAREACFHILFETEFQEGKDPQTLMDSFLEGFLEEPETEKDAPTDKDREFILREVSGTLSHRPEIDEKITACLKGWKLSRLSKVDLTILRLAVYELLYAEDIPESVTINEAVELAKNFSEETSGGFVNGVLANFATPRG